MIELRILIYAIIFWAVIAVAEQHNYDPSLLCPAMVLLGVAMLFYGGLRWISSWRHVRGDHASGAPVIPHAG